MNQIITARFQADGAAVYLPFGFIPDFFLMVDLSTDTNIDFYYWWKWMEDEGASGYQDGVLVNEGATDGLASGSGISSYNTASNAPTVTEWTASASPTAKSGDAHGSYYRPTRTGGKGDYDAIFECLAGTTTDTTEPSWPKDPGGTVTDNNVTWKRVDGDVALTRVGYQGIAVDVSLTNDHVVLCLALQADQSINFGDVAGWTGGVYGA